MAEIAKQLKQRVFIPPKWAVTTQQLRAYALGRLSGPPPRALEASTIPPVNLKAPRLINRFKIGADPEFALCNVRGALVNADRIGLASCAAAFGGDGSGRPVELRLHPEKYCVKVLASLLTTLRCLALQNSSANDCPTWVSGGFHDGWALGGHIHFGRRQIETSFLRSKEGNALDSLALGLNNLGLLIGQGERSSRSSYGRYGDIRNQTWGYEYRTLPSWLESPRYAHCILTLSKIAVRDPETWNGFDFGGTELALSLMTRIANILKFYRYLDDDAALAYSYLRDFFAVKPVHNIRTTWGIDRPYPKELFRVVPETIPGDSHSVKEILAALRTGLPPVWREPDTTELLKTSPATVPVPAEFASTVNVIPVQFGNENSFMEHSLESTFKNLCGIKGGEVRIGNGEYGIFAPLEWVDLLTREELRRVQDMLLRYGASFKVEGYLHGLSIELGAYSRNATQIGASYKAVFSSGLLPFTFTPLLTPAWVGKWKTRLGTDLLRLLGSVEPPPPATPEPLGSTSTYRFSLPDMPDNMWPPRFPSSSMRTTVEPFGGLGSTYDTLVAQSFQAGMAPEQVPLLERQVSQPAQEAESSEGGTPEDYDYPSDGGQIEEEE